MCFPVEQVLRLYITSRRMKRKHVFNQPSSYTCMCPPEWYIAEICHRSRRWTCVLKIMIHLSRQKCEETQMFHVILRPPSPTPCLKVSVVAIGFMDVTCVSILIPPVVYTTSLLRSEHKGAWSYTARRERSSDK